MICPECQTKITSKHYDPSFEWYECPKCEGCWTVAELEGERSRNDGRGGSNGGSNSGGVVGDRVRAATTKVVAKGKKRRTEIQEDDEARAVYESKMLKPVKVEDKETHHRDEIPVKEVVSIMADELEAIYREFGVPLDTLNARDKALTLWREVHYKDGVHAREKPVEHVLCGVHSD
jgi:hypothetical protein